MEVDEIERKGERERKSEREGENEWRIKQQKS